MDSYSVEAVLSVKDKNFTSTMKSAQSTLSGLDSSTQKSSNSVGLLGTAFAVAQSVVSGACNVIKNSVEAAVSRVDTLNQYPKIMEQMGFSSEAAEASVQKLSEGIQGLPTSLDSIVSSAQNIALMTGDLDTATDVALALNNALIASGASTDDAARATEQYEKMLSAGKVTSQQWTTLEQTMKYALVEVAKQLGITSGSTQELYSALQSGEITFDQFNAALVECSEAQGGFADMAQTASAGIATSWENVKTAVVRGVANMIQSWNEAAADNSLPTIQESLNSLRNVVDTVFNAASKAVTVFVNNLDLLLAVCAPVVAGLAAFKIVESVGNMFESCKNKVQESAKVLQEYQSKAETVAAAQEKLKTAEEMAATAQEKYTSAVDKAFTALKQKQDAESAAETAVQNLKQAEEELTNTTGDRTEAEAKVEEATKKKEAAEKAAAEAVKLSEEAEKAKAEASQETAAASEYATMAEEEYGAAVEGATLKEIAMSAMSNVLTGDMTIATAATEAFNAAWDANPIGLVIAAITTAITVITAVIKVLQKFGILENTAAKESKEFKESVEELTDSIQENRDAMEESTASAQNQSSIVNDLCAKVTELAAQENKSAEDTSLLRSYIDQLNESVDGLNLAYDETTDSLNMATEAMMAQAEVENKADEYATAQDNYNQALQDYLAIGDELVAAEELEAETADASIVAKQRQKSAVKELEEAQTEQAEVLEGALGEMQAAEAEYTAAQNEACALQEQALQESVANQTLTLDELSEANQSTAEELQSTWQDYTDIATDMFDTLDTEVETTVDDMIENMQKNQEVMATWGDNTEALRDRFAALGLDPAILDQLVDLGPEGAGYIQELCDASDEKLEELVDVYSEGGETAYTAMSQSMGEGAAEVIDQAKDLVMQTEESFRSQVEATDWTSLGTSMDEGVVEGIETGSAEVQTSAGTMATDARTAAGEAAGEGSPAAEWIPLGESMVEGVGEGLTNSTAAQEAATQMCEQLVQTVEEALSSADLSSAVDSMCAGMAEATTTGMQQVSTAVTSAMNDATTALNNGFSQMASATTTNMGTINSAVASGMTTVSSSVTSGMSTVTAAMSSGFSNMTSTVSSQMSGIASTISSGMSNIASTMSSSISNISNTLKTGFNNMSTDVKTQMNNIKTTITNSLNNIKSTVTTQTNNIKTTVTNCMNNLKSTTTSGMNSVKSTFSNALSTMKSTASSICSGIVSTFNSLYSSLYSAGASAMSGLQAGLNSRRGSVMSTAQSIANSVRSTINSALKVGSPSRVMKETGKYVVEGLVVGLKSMLDDVERVSEQMADMVNNIAIGDFDTPNLAFAGMDISVAYEFGTEDILDALGDLKDVLLEDSQKPIQVETVIDMDAKEVAKATATYTQDELNKIEARNSRRQQFSIGG